MWTVSRLVPSYKLARTRRVVRGEAPGGGSINILCESLESLFYCKNDLDPDINSVNYRDPKLNPCK